MLDREQGKGPAGEEIPTHGSKSAQCGYSLKINDPAFARYVQNSNRWSAIFASVLAVLAVAGFFIYGETGSEMDNPEALFIGLGIGGMFMAIALGQIVKRNRSQTWDGVVTDKKVEQKKRKRHTGNRKNWEHYTLFTVFIRRDDNGNMYQLSAENSDLVYNYYQVGDKVRHHAHLDTFEKCDKSQDTIIFCNACRSLNEVSADYCCRCKCPLLK